MNYNKVQFEAAFGTLKQIPESDLPEIVFAGRSNVGKSSMLNRLFNRKNLARVSSVPGKTITINFFKVEDVRIVDLPGYGYAKVAKGEKRRWAEMMEGYFRSPRNIKLVVQLVDMRHKPSEDDYIMMRFLKDAGLPFIVAATKSDKLNKTQYNERKNALKEELAEFGDNLTILPFSSEKGEGTDELKSIIESVL
ncbi:MAG: YihA family ribosome biogenesis GTP-binding protein [Ruminococcaceae bacterium]|nr:YihA family ribosome biogenesis GTP-binding protein [Oscillospiraceae bacterium]